MVSRIHTNFSRLTDNNECNCLSADEIKIQFVFDVREVSEHLRNSLLMLEIGCKSFGNRWPCRRKSFCNLHLRLSSEVEGKSSAIFGSRQKIFGNLWKQSVKIFGNLSSAQTKNPTHFTEKSWQV